MSEELYVQIWKDNISDILKFIKEGGGEKYLDGARFEEAGDRKNYGFRLDIENGNIPVKSGNAVARDLKLVLDKNKEFKSLAKDKNIVIRMGTKFDLHVIVNPKQDLN